MDFVAEELPALLQVQNFDTEVEQLRHQKDLLQARDDLQNAIDKQAAHKQLLQQTNEQRIKALIRQNRCENEAAICASSVDSKNELLYSGKVNSLRNIKALQTEIETLRSRQNDLEDQAIEALIEADDLASKAEELEAQSSSLDELVTVLQTEQDVAVNAIEERLADVSEARQKAAATVDVEVLATYKELRPRFGHSTVVSFDETKGCNCPSRMPIAEIARIRQCQLGSTLDCTECGRMVLR